MRKRTTAALGATAVLVLAGAGCSDEGNVFSLEEGTCFEDPGSSFEVSDVETVDCDDPHFAEVYHTEDLEGGDNDDFPGNAEVGAEGNQICESEFEGFVGAPLGQSDFVFSAFQPTEDSWDQGDREIACFIVSPSGEDTEGSAEDSGPSEGGGVVPPAGGGGEAGDPTPPPNIADPTHTALAQECFDGSGSACDELFAVTPVDSPEEEYGATCGGRFDASPGLCSTAIGG